MTVRTPVLQYGDTAELKWISVLRIASCVGLEAPAALLRLEMGKVDNNANVLFRQLRELPVLLQHRRGEDCAEEVKAWR